jgi:CubicO group peptidase (beta-lactamase class C family)
MTDEPGEVFNYSSGLTHLLSAILTEASNLDTCSVVHQRLFGPMGISAEHWGRDTQGIFSGGYNLYLTPRELAKIALLILSQGRFAGKQLVSAAWIDRATRAQIDAGSGYRYGYLFWLRTMAGHEVQIAWGFGGQFIYLVPSLDLAVVITSDTRSTSVDFDGEDLMSQTIIPAVEP